LAEHFASSIANNMGEFIVQPLLEEPIGNSDQEQAIFLREFRVLSKPELIPCFSDPSGNCLAQHGQGFLISGRHAHPPARSRSVKVEITSSPERS
jgi:hypothetical protein